MFILISAFLIQDDNNKDFRSQVNNLVLQCKAIRDLIAETYSNIIHVANAQNSADKDYDKAAAVRLMELENFLYRLLTDVHLSL